MTKIIHVNCDTWFDMYGVVFPENVSEGFTPYGLPVEVSDEDYSRIGRISDEFMALQNELYEMFSHAQMVNYTGPIIEEKTDETNN